MKHTFVILAFKESEYLEECIKSVLNQKLKTNAVIATSTPNKFIDFLAKKYKLKVIVNENGGTISKDFNFALNCVKSDLITIAHQDDIYNYEYAFNMVNYFKKYSDAIILFSDYYEIKNNVKVFNNTNLRIKRMLLLPLGIKSTASWQLNKRAVLKFGNAISCPAVTFAQKKVLKDIFVCDFKCNLDWNAWERLSKLKGSFIFINKKLMGHRVHAGSTTTSIIKDNIRTKEDMEMFSRFWPNKVAKLLARLYKKSEKSNEI